MYIEAANEISLQTVVHNYLVSSKELLVHLLKHWPEQQHLIPLLFKETHGLVGSVMESHFMSIQKIMIKTTGNNNNIKKFSF